MSGRVTLGVRRASSVSMAELAPSMMVSRGVTRGLWSEIERRSRRLSQGYDLT